METGITSVYSSVEISLDRSINTPMLQCPVFFSTSEITMLRLGISANGYAHVCQTTFSAARRLVRNRFLRKSAQISLLVVSRRKSVRVQRHFRLGAVPRDTRASGDSVETVEESRGSSTRARVLLASARADVPPFAVRS